MYRRQLKQRRDHQKRVVIGDERRLARSKNRLNQRRQRSRSQTRRRSAQVLLIDPRRPRFQTERLEARARSVKGKLRGVQRQMQERDRIRAALEKRVLFDEKQLKIERALFRVRGRRRQTPDRERAARRRQEEEIKRIELRVERLEPSRPIERRVQIRPRRAFARGDKSRFVASVRRTSRQIHRKNRLFDKKITLVHRSPLSIRYDRPFYPSRSFLRRRRARSSPRFRVRRSPPSTRNRLRHFNKIFPNFYKSRRFIRFYFLKRFAGAPIFPSIATLRIIAKTAVPPFPSHSLRLASFACFNVSPKRANRRFPELLPILTRIASPSKARRSPTR